MDTETIWHRRHEILYRLELSVLYHQKRERFFELWDKLSKAVAVIGGSAIMSKISPDMLFIVAGIITVTSTLSLVFGFSDRSKRHSELARNFRQLEADVVRKGESGVSESDVNVWKEKTHQLESQEPPALGALVILCQNELAVAANQSEKVVKMPCHERWLAQFIDFHPLTPH